MTKLLVSVRSLAEARMAVRSGADLIDVKEPLRGSLGRPDEAVVDSIVREIGGQLPISVALGDLRDDFVPLPCPGVDFVKLGLTGWGRQFDWRDRLDRAGRSQKSASKASLIAVAYADWQLADAPAPDDVVRFAAEHAWAGMLLDTSIKNGRSLVDWCELYQLSSLIEECCGRGLLIALAGSLRVRDIRPVAALGPTYVGVRGLACENGKRSASLDPERVERLAHLVATIPAGTR